MPTPQFDDSQPFEKASTPPEFDESKPFDKVALPSTSQKFQDALQGAGNALTGGYLPTLQAKAGRMLFPSLFEDPNAELDAKLKEGGATIQQPDWNDPETQQKMYEAQKASIQQNDPDNYNAGALVGAGVAASPGLIGGAKLIPAAAKGLIGLGKNEAIKSALQVGGPLAAYLLGKKKSSE